MTLSDVLRFHIGYKVSLSFPRIDVSSTFKDYQCQGNLHLIFWHPAKGDATYVAEDEYSELEDYPEIDQDTIVGDTDWFQFRAGDMVYAIDCKKVDDSVAQFQPVRLANDFHELTNVSVYKRHRQSTRVWRSGDESKFSSPELYILEFTTGDKIVIYYNEAGPYKSIFYSEQDFLDSIYQWKRLSMKDFELLP